MPRGQLICTQDITVDDVGKQSHTYKRGDVFKTNRWFLNALLEKHPDAFANWTAELEAELKPKRGRRSAKAQDATSES